MNNTFYRALEEKYRGSRDLIKERLQVYLPFIKPLLQHYAEARVIDLGCGRGEWLELLIEEKFKPTGADLDEGMLATCHELGLPAVRVEAIDFLSKTETESQVVVSAFHFVEHISFENLRALLIEALRVLKPGGVLILETPNPENIVISTRNFYLDPTHQRPIPPELLAFVVEFEGFKSVKILRLNENKDIVSSKNIGLTDVLNFVSPDYAVIAQKAADASLMAKSQELFNTEYGVSLDNMSIKLDKRLERIEAQSVKAIELTEQAIKLTEQLYHASEQYLAQLGNVYASKSWRVTAPLRWVSGRVKRIRQDVLIAIQKILCKISRELLLYPRLCQWLISCFRILGLKASMKRLHDKANGQHTHSNDLLSVNFSFTRQLQYLPPRAQQIYDELRNAIKEQKRGRG